MKKQFTSLTDSRHELLEKIAAQREEMVEISLQWQVPLTLVDTGLSAAHFIRSHPTFLSGAVAGLWALRGTSATGLALNGLRLLYLYPSILSKGFKLLSSAVRLPAAGRKNDADY